MNKINNIRVLACLFLGSFSLIGNVEAALVSVLGGQAVYDTDRDITWLSNYSAAAGTVFDDGVNSADGRLTWQNANDWAASLTVGGLTNWRLPVTPELAGTCTDDMAGTLPSSDAVGYNCTGSEMGHLFYDELGGTAGFSITSSGDPDLALFSNLTPFNTWSLTEYSLNSDSAWVFNFAGGLQQILGKDSELRAWAVHDGGAELVSAIPVPPAILLFATGVAGLIGVRRRIATPGRDRSVGL